MDKVLKWVLIGCLIIPVVIVMIAVLAGIVLVALNPAEQIDRAREATQRGNINSISRMMAIIKVDTLKDIVTCEELGEELDVEPRSENSCIVKMGESVQQDTNIIYSYNVAANCALISTATPVDGESKFLYQDDTVPVTGSDSIKVSDKIMECE